jgi:hypothetical protein
VRGTNEQSISADLTKRIAELMSEVAALRRRLELLEGARGNGRRDQNPHGVIYGSDHTSNPIELLTENGFSIVRPWESDKSYAPSGGQCRFFVNNGEATEREIRVEISPQLMSETSLRTRGRIQPSSSFWICCAERHLANYVWEHDAFPEGNKLLIETLDAEEVILVRRWSE